MSPRHVWTLPITASVNHYNTHINHIDVSEPRAFTQESGYDGWATCQSLHFDIRPILAWCHLKLMVMFLLIGNEACGKAWNWIVQIRRAGSLDKPLHVSSHAYFGLIFPCLIEPFPFLAHHVVQTPSWGQMQEGVSSQEDHSWVINQTWLQKSQSIFFLFVFLWFLPDFYVSV